jgi:predicted nucleic-acid-binding Zn-ribbon protein
LEKCPKCGSTEIDTGILTGNRRLGYASFKVKIQLHKDNVRTKVCMNCGYTEIYVDPNYFNRIKRQ